MTDNIPQCVNIQYPHPYPGACIDEDECALYGPWDGEEREPECEGHESLRGDLMGVHSTVTEVAANR